MSLADQIRESLKSISANDLQRLAEEMACIKFPSRYAERLMYRRGRNEYSQTTKGWPDAFIERDDGSIDAIEATRDRVAWQSHLQSDLEHLSDGDSNLASFFFVGGYPQQAPTESVISDWRQKFIDAGLSREDVTILVGGSLVLELQEPRYARVRQELLGISSAPTMFKMIGRGVAPRKAIGSFQPGENDYANGLVRAPLVFNEVRELLAREKKCVVLGVGAAGKTTLAELVARSEEFGLLPSWYLDVARVGENELAMARNEMVELCSEGVLFVVDNFHLNDGLANDLFTHWRNHCASSGARILLLGRDISGPEKDGLFGIEPILLRPSFEELCSIVRRLCLSRDLSVPAIDDGALGDWAEIFGGSRDESTAAIDLIIFTAAVDARIENISQGDLELRPDDWKAAARVRYLLPVERAGELENLLRLASLAELDIGLSDEDLPSEVAGLQTSIFSLGLVVADRAGLEGRAVYSMQHAHIGRLLIDCSHNVDVESERLAAIRKNVAIGLRVLAKERASTSDVRSRLEAYVHALIQERNWKNFPYDIYDLVRLGRYAVSRKILNSNAIDDHMIDSGLLDRALRRTRAIQNLVAFVSFAELYGLRRSLEKINFEVLKDGSPLSRVLFCASPSDLGSLCSKIESGPIFIGKLNLDRWARLQKERPPELAVLAFGAVAVLREAGREDLAACVATKMLANSDVGLWKGGQVDHLSHILRLAKYPRPQTDNLVKGLNCDGWFDDVYERIGIGSLCGALMSFANYMPPELRDLILTQSLSRRVLVELAKHLPEKAENAAKRVCLIGCFGALGGQVSREKISWSFAGRLLDSFLAQWVPRVQRPILGMYELQFWSGVMALTECGVPDLSASLEAVDGFVGRLRTSVPSAPGGDANKQRLLIWMNDQIESQKELDNGDESEAPSRKLLHFSPRGAQNLTESGRGVSF